MARLQEVYNETLIPKLSEKLGIKNRHAIPRLMKIVVSMGVGKATQDRKRLEEAVISTEHKCEWCGCSSHFCPWVDP